MAVRTGVPYVLIGGQWSSKGRTATAPPTPPPPSTTARFPGDTQTKITGKIIIGLDEHDKNPRALDTANGEVVAPESLAGKPSGAVRLYYKSWQALTAAARTDALAQLRAGRIPWISILVAPGNDTAQTWAEAADGRNFSIWYAWIAWVETVATGPIWFTLIHEPEDNIGGAGMGTGNFADLQVAFRAAMTQYAADHAVDGVYKWKNLAFGPVFTAYGFARKDSASVTHFMTRSNGTAVPRSTFDFMGVDYYVGLNVTSEPSYWTTNWQAALAYAESHGYPILVGEYGVKRSYADAGQKLVDFHDRILNDPRDVGAILYYNSSLANPPSAGAWMLDDRGNDGLATKFVNLMKADSTVRYYELGQGYAPPAGIIG